nr:EOG090X0BWU [Macrothrix elegans]
MENMENVLDELNVLFMALFNYNRQQTPQIPKLLEDYINHLAKTGETLFPWSKIRGVLRHKLEIVIANFKEACPTENLPPCPNVEPFHYETMKDKIFEQFDSFNCAPFTIQRLCELLSAPRKHYKRTDKFMRGIEKNLLVVSTVDPDQSRKRSESVASSQTLINGIVDTALSTSKTTTACSVIDKAEQRPSSVASDVASVDADSGISDTEDEEKPSAKPAEAQTPDNAVEDNSGATDNKEASSSLSTVVDSNHSEEKVDNQGSSASSDTVSKEDKMEEEEEEVEEKLRTSEDVKSQNVSEEETARDESKKEEEEEESSAANCDEWKTNAQNEAVASIQETAERVDDGGEITSREGATPDKKRPLEKAEGEDGSDSPEAKQPRITSPDETENHPTTETSVPESSTVLEDSATEANVHKEPSLEVEGNNGSTESPPGDNKTIETQEQ